MHPVMTLIINKITQHISNLGHYCNALTLLLGWHQACCIYHSTLRSNNNPNEHKLIRHKKRNTLQQTLSIN